MKKYFMLALSFIAVFYLCFSSFTTDVYAETNEINVNAKSAILVDYNSGEVLYGQNEDAKLEIASMVKLMTTYLTLEAVQNGEISLQDNLIASEHASSMGGSQVFIDSGEKYNVEKMLQSVIMASANDASVALAEHIAGSEKNFVNKMNEKAKEFGMLSTQYANATGLPAPMQFSTAKDTSIMLSKLIENEVYHKYASMWMDSLTHPSGRKTDIVNTNKLTRYYKGCDCGKTGFTDEAGYCLASSVKRDNMRLISVVIGTTSAKERFSESVNLFNYGFANFENKIIIDENVSFGEVNIKRSDVEKIQAFPKENFYALVKKGEKSAYEFNINLMPSIKAPVVEGDGLGVITVTKNGEIVKEIEVVSKEDVKAFSYGEAFGKILQTW